MSEKNSNDELAEELLEAVYKNDVSKIRTIIKDHESLLNYTYNLEGKRILLIACSKRDINAETVTTLLDLNANPHDYGEGDGWETIHWAANNVNFEILKILLERNPDMINALDTYDNNALHIIIRYGDQTSTDFEKCVELLIEKGIDVTQKNVKNTSPIDWAIKNHINSDLTDKIKNKIDENRIRVTEGSILLGFLRQGDEKQFVNFNDGNINEWVDYKEESHTLLQMCCEKDLTEAAVHLLHKGVDYEETSRKNSLKPITIAAEKGNKEIFAALLDKYSQLTKIPGELLPTVVKYIDREYHDNIGCYEVFIAKMEEWKETRPDDVSFKLNEGDEQGNTALHYAVVYAEPDVVEKLLHLGASLGAKNNDGVMPIKNIDVDILKNHLDKCVEFDLEKRKSEKEEFEVKFNYRTLIPPYLQLQVENDNVNFNRDAESAELQPKSAVRTKLIAETEVINFMSKTSELKELLMHPVITSYLHLKWLKVQWIFWVNLACYVFFASSLLIYIYIDLKPDKSKFLILGSNILQTFFSMGSSAILFRELLQIIMAPKKYFMNIENYMELFLMVLSAMIALDLHFLFSKKELFALTTLFLAFELVLLLGHHPTFSTNVVMFRTVSYNFYKFFLWYSLPIIAFAISFYLIITVENEEATNTGDKYKPFAANLWQSLFKTLIMLTGEFDSGNINFEEYHVTSKLIFTAFVFTIAIILLNLLSGLAVSDTQMIQSHAELVGYVVRTQFISSIETVLMGNLPIATWAPKLIDVNSLPNNRDWNFSLVQFLLQISCIFPNYFNYEGIVYPRKDGLIKYDLNHSRIIRGNFSNVCLDHNSIQRTTTIIKERVNEEIQKRERFIQRKQDQEDLLKSEEMQKRDRSIETIKYQQDLLSLKIDKILTIITSPKMLPINK